MDKTNVMRVLDSLHIAYKAYEYPCDGSVPSGVEVARFLHQDETHVFKTLVTVDASGKNYVFVIPVGEELSLKKAAVAPHRLYSRRLFPHWDEKAVSHGG